MKISIINGRLIDPSKQLEQQQSLHIADGRILAIGEAPAGFSADETLDVQGCIVIPGLVDLQARLREPGEKHKGNIASETRAAVHGGITTLCCPPDTSPVIDSPAVAKLICDKAASSAHARVVPLGALTQGLEGEQLSELVTLQRAGCVGFSNGRRPLPNSMVLRRAMEYAVTHDLTLFLHPEDRAMAANGCAHEGAISLRLGLPSIPESAETLEVARVLILVQQTGCRVHFGQISAAHTVELIAQAKQQGQPVSCDVSAHQLHLSEMDILDFNSQCHTRPPLRSLRDRDALREGLRQGVIEAICSDHQPHDLDAKLAPFCESEPGISALETLLPLSLRLHEELGMPLSALLATLTSKPAAILGLEGGSLEIGGVADLCIVDLEHCWQLDEDRIQSHGKNTPFLHWEFKGQVTHTLIGGRCVFSRADMA